MIVYSKIVHFFKDFFLLAIVTKIVTITLAVIHEIIFFYSIWNNEVVKHLRKP